MKNKINTARHILFWSWNIIFIVFVNLGLMPIIGSDIMYGLKMGNINKDFVAFFAVVLVVPAISALLGFIYLGKDSKKLFELMYCIELPLLALTLFRIFFLRDLTAGVGFFLALFGASSIYFAYRLFFMRRPNSFQNLAGATMFLWCGAWIFLMLSFLIPPMANGAFEGAKAILIGLSDLTIADLFKTMFGFFFVLIGAIFVIYTATLFVLFPIIYIYSSFKNWQLTASHLFSINKKKTVALVAGTAIAITAIFIASTRQNHEAVLTTLQSLAGTDAEKIEIGSREKDYRKALSDVYLAPYRYMGDYSKSNFIQDIYKRTFNTEYESTRWVQVLFNNIARPFIYRGSSNGMAQDQQLAERFYGDLFDSSIQEDERESIRYAVQSTYSREQIDAGLININEKRVHLDKQELSLKENGEWADVELHEVYYNSSFRPEEIFLHLKLPPGAVINGVWLSDDETKKFAATVAPRGRHKRSTRRSSNEERIQP
ncbi:MAG: TIGR02921 family PEP-CTERM protein [Bdellovibrionales bacterium]|nr:TIGR02921 family PEP-CTERM protein [Bdellovibrionales bacterium]